MIDQYDHYYQGDIVQNLRFAKRTEFSAVHHSRVQVHRRPVQV